MSRIACRRPSNESGFTLLELLVALAITVLIAQVALVMTRSTEASLQKATDQLTVAQQATRLAHYLKYDISSSNDVYIFSTVTAGEDPTKNCRSDGWAAKGLADTTKQQGLQNWSTPTRVRTLFAVEVQDVPTATGPTAVPGPAALLENRYLVSYELHVSKSSAEPSSPPAGATAKGAVSIWRLECNVTGVIQKADPIVTFADASVSEVLNDSRYSGAAMLKCVDGTSCLPNSSTFDQYVTWYKLSVPYTGSRSTLRKLIPDSLNQFKRGIDFRCKAGTCA